MPDKFKNKYRSETTRLKGRDYSVPGKYYVTINTLKREPYFGKISDGKMILSDMGIIAKTCYLEIPNHFKNVHAPYRAYWKPGTLGVIINQFDMLSLSKHKSSVTRIANKKHPVANFAWHALFHDRIIRMDEYEKIKLYIRNNIRNWKNN